MTLLNMLARAAYVSTYSTWRELYVSLNTAITKIKPYNSYNQYFA